MPKFDHRFDNAILTKDRLEFTDEEDAVEFAISQYNAYPTPQAILKEDATGLFRVREVLPGYDYPNCTVVQVINSLTSD